MCAAGGGGGSFPLLLAFGGEADPDADRFACCLTASPATPPALAAAARRPPFLAFLSLLCLFLPSNAPEPCLAFLDATERDRESSSSSEDASATAAAAWDGRLRVWPGA